MVHVQIEAGHQSSKATVVGERASRQGEEDGLIGSFHYKGSAPAGNIGLSPASSGVGKHTHAIALRLPCMGNPKLAGVALVWLHMFVWAEAAMLFIAALIA